MVNDNVKNEIREKLKGDEIDPYKFEKLMTLLVAKILEKDEKTIKRAFSTKKSNDGGIDGIVEFDLFGLDKIYIQCKKYSENLVDSNEVRNFIGSLNVNNAEKGLFITTSKFSPSAKETKEKCHYKIKLIDIDELIDLMFENNVGIEENKNYIIKKIDDDFFDLDE